MRIKELYEEAKNLGEHGVLGLTEEEFILMKSKLVREVFGNSFNRDYALIKEEEEMEQRILAVAIDIVKSLSFRELIKIKIFK